MEQKITVPKGCKIESVEHDDNQIVIMFSEDKKKEVKIWEDLIGKNIPNSSVFFEGEDAALFSNEMTTFDEKTKGIFLDERHAKSALAMAQISQLMEYFGGKITDEEWSNINIIKYVICRNSEGISMGCYTFNYDFIAFHTAEQRDKFLKYNEQLVKDYLMLD